MAIISDLVADVLNRLEEDPTNPIFWDVQDEIRVFLADAMFEASLITGEPQIRQTTPLTLLANQTLQPMPPNALAILRIDGPGKVDKVSWYELDKMTPGWRNDPPSDTIDAWFPFGLSQFGIHPQLEVEQQVFVTYVSIPVQVPRPYTGAEPVNFQAEYLEGFVDSATHDARTKEGGQELLQSLANLERYLTKMEELSKFGLRKGSLRFTKVMGATAKQTEIEIR
jgi:hypothetical protein